MFCSKCHKECKTDNPHFTGYSKDDEGNILCYACCGELDRAYMRDHDRITLYLTYHNLTDQIELNLPRFEVTNWPGTLRYAAHVSTTIKKYTTWRIRHDVWFEDETGVWWYGRHQGENNELVYCKRLKWKPDFLYGKNMVENVANK